MKPKAVAISLAPIALAFAFFPTVVMAESAHSEPAPSAGKQDATEAIPPIIQEADLPAGFPDPGPAYEIRLKSYPAYRAARAHKGGNKFGRLFRHINKHDIAMTVPVEMTLDADSQPYSDSPSLRPIDITFMYARPDMGETGPDGSVEVIDLPAINVLSYGYFGRDPNTKRRDAFDKLKTEFAARPDLEQAGPPRVMGYNSPSIPNDKRYAELQIPVRKIETQSE